jgi:cation:H+ antiporter
MVLLFAQYFLLAFIVIFATSKASYFIDELDKKTNIGGALIGGLLLATITSMPEFITSFTATVVLDDPGLAFGNVFGSNLFNILILGVADIVFIKHLFFNKVKTARVTNGLVIIMYLIFLLPLALYKFGWLELDMSGIGIGIGFNVISIAILIVYFLSIKKMNEEEVEDTEDTSKLSFKRITIMFALWSVVVIGSSYFVTVVVDNLDAHLGLGSSFAGAIFLGVATSLPEFTAVFTLFKLKNYEAALGNIVGSNIFNMAILSVVDIIDYKENLYVVLLEDDLLRENIFLLLILGLINSIILMFALYRKKAVNKLTYIIPSILIIIGYLVYVGLSIIL